MKRLKFFGAMLGLTALLSACGGGGETPPDTQADNAIRAERVGGKINGNALKLGHVVLDISSDPDFGVAEVDAANAFTLDLGGLTPPALFPLTQDCTATGANTNPNAQTWANSVFDAYGPQGDHLGTVVERIVSGTGLGSSQSRISRVYASADARFRGICAYSDALTGVSYTDDYDVTLKAGWNALALTVDGTSYTYRNIGGDTRSELRFTADEPRVSVLLKPETLTVAGDDAVTADAVFAQVGGYSGAVTLKTDDPDLLVEPATLTLPALAVQPQSVTGSAGEGRLTPQSVPQKLTFRYKGTDNGSRPFRVLVQDGQGKQVGAGSGLLNVLRPGIQVSSSGQGIRVTPGGTAQLPVELRSIGSFSGEVTVRLEGLPSGVTANTWTASLNGYASSFLTLMGGAGLTPGEYQATLVAEGGGRSARTAVGIVIPKPSVSLSVNSSSFSGIGVYQGSTGGIEVTVTSNAGFNGSTTLTVVGLPTGVSASPVSAQVTPGMTTVVRIPLTVAADAPVGNTTVRVTSPDAAESSSSTTAQLNVLPARTPFVATNSLAATNEGVWGVRSASNPAQGRTVSSLVLSDGQGVVRELSLPAEFGPDTRVSSGPDGTLWVYDPSSYPSRVGVIPAGTGTVSSVDLGEGAVDLLVVDAGGQAYAAQRVPSSANAHVLRRITPGGTVVTLPGVNPQGLSINVTGTTVFVLGDGRLFRIEAATGGAASQELPTLYSGQLAVTPDGTVWALGSNTLVRVNPDGSLNTVPLNGSAGGLLYADRTKNVLYVEGGYSNYGSVTRFDTQTGQQTVLPIRNSGGLSTNMAIAPASAGGLWATYSEIENGTSNYTILGYLVRLP